MEVEPPTGRIGVSHQNPPEVDSLHIRHQNLPFMRLILINLTFTDPDLEENECLDFTLFVTGLKPAKVMTGLVCQIQHHPNPVTLVVEVAFKVRTYDKLLWLQPSNKNAGFVPHFLTFFEGIF